MARQLFLRLTVVGLVLAVLTATGQLYVEYRRDLAALEARLGDIELSYLPSVRENAWLDDRERLGTLAEGIQQLPGLAEVVVRSPNGEVIARAGAAARVPLVRTSELRRDYANQQVNLGHLEVTADLALIREGALHRLWLTMAGNLLLVFALAAVLYGQVHTLVTGRLMTIARYARHLGRDGPAATQLPAPARHGHDNELSDLEQTLTRMHADLSAAHEALSASEARYRELFTSSPVSLWEQDFSAVRNALEELRPDMADIGPWLEANPDFVRRCAGLVRVIDVNEAALSMHRATSRDELLSRLTATFAPVSFDAFRCQLEAIYAGGHDLVLESQVRTLDGDIIDVVLHWHVPRSHRQRYTRVIVSQEDVTQLKMARRSSDITLERLMQANAELERFTFVASHDLQEPVRAVVSFAQLLERRLSQEAALSDDVAEFLDFLRAAAGRMQAQVAGLQDYTRAGQSLGAFAPVALEDALADARTLMSDQLANASIEVRPLPTVVGDRAQLAQLFRHLIDNSVKFRAGDRPLRITVSAALEAGAWRITVRDNGIGIDPAYAGTVFDVFRRLHGPGQYPGAGLGLAVCRRIAERHGGTITVDTTVMDGAAVVLTLPPADLATAAPAA